MYLPQYPVCITNMIDRSRRKNSNEYFQDNAGTSVLIYMNHEIVIKRHRFLENFTKAGIITDNDTESHLIDYIH